MLCVNCQLAAWANNAAVGATLLPWKWSEDINLACPPLQRECVLWPAENQGCTAIRAEPPPGQVKEVEEQNSVSCGRNAGADPFSCCYLNFTANENSCCPFLLYVEMAESTDTATQAVTSHRTFSVQYKPVSWALCHVDGLHPIWAAFDLTAERGCCCCRKTPLLAEGEVIWSAVGDRNGSELNIREKDWYKALGKEPDLWREAYLYIKILNFVVDCSKHFFKLI